VEKAAGAGYSGKYLEVKFLYLILGGGLGTVARYLVAVWSLKVYENNPLPVGTILVNVAGSFLIGLLWGYSNNWEWTKEARLFVFVGLFGGFTTFSSFSLETLTLVRENEWRLAILNVLISNVLGILLVFLGFWLGNLAAKK